MLLPKAIRPYYELCKAVTSFLTVLIPLLEKWQAVLPVSSQVRQECLTIAVFVCFLATVAGYSTGRHTVNGLSVGWCFLLLFLVASDRATGRPATHRLGGAPPLRADLRLLQPLHFSLSCLQRTQECCFD